MSNEESIKAIDVEGLPLVVIRSLAAMVAKLREELQGLPPNVLQSEQIWEKHPWTVIDGVKIGVVTREDFSDDL